MPKYAAFLSFANSDRELVYSLHKLFEEVGLTTYFAPEELPKRGSDEWRKTILNSMKDCQCVIPVLTRHSILRPWVLYEIGAADMQGLPIYRARTVDITSTQLQQMPGTDGYAFNLSDEQNLKDLILKVCEHSRGADFRNNVEKMVTKLLEEDKLAYKIRELSSLRKVFIGGSPPTNREHLDKLKIKNESSTGNELLGEVVKNFTKNLLEEGFFVSSCPDTSVVGVSVAKAAIDWAKKNGKKLTECYSIQGNLQLICDESDETGLLHVLESGFMESRKQYLKDYEYLVVFGGNSRSMLECRAARELGTVKIIPVPCIGGTALEIYNSPNFKTMKFDNVKVWNGIQCEDLHCNNCN